MTECKVLGGGYVIPQTIHVDEAALSAADRAALRYVEGWVVDVKDVSLGGLLAVARALQARFRPEWIGARAASAASFNEAADAEDRRNGGHGCRSCENGFQDGLREALADLAVQYER